MIKECNGLIKRLIKEKGLYNYQIAQKLGCSECKLSKMLNREITFNEFQDIMNAIFALEEER